MELQLLILEARQPLSTDKDRRQGFRYGSPSYALKTGI